MPGSAPPPLRLIMPPNQIIAGLSQAGGAGGQVAGPGSSQTAGPGTGQMGPGRVPSQTSFDGLSRSASETCEQSIREVLWSVNGPWSQ